ARSWLARPSSPRLAARSRLPRASFPPLPGGSGRRYRRACLNCDRLPSGGPMKRPRLDPVVWRPPPWPERARRRVGPEPFPALRTVPVGGHGPEDVAVDAAGAVLTGLEDGRVLRVDTGTGSVRTLADTGGRPLGLEVLPDRRILVCDARRGLLRLDPATGEVATLVSHVAGERLRFCSNAVADQDGTVYFTSSTARFDFEHWRGDIMEHSGTGRLMRLDPGGEVSVLLDGLQF